MSVYLSVLHSWGDYSGRFASAMLITILTEVVFTLLSLQGERYLHKSFLHLMTAAHYMSMSWSMISILGFMTDYHLASVHLYLFPLCFGLSAVGPLLFGSTCSTLTVAYMYWDSFTHSLLDCFCSHLQILSNLKSWLIACVPDIISQFNIQKSAI